MQEGSIPEIPIVSDVKGYTPTGKAAEAEGVSLGFPCQASIKLAPDVS